MVVSDGGSAGPPDPDVLISDERHVWIKSAIAETEAWIAAELRDAQVERMFSSPGSWNYDVGTDLERQVDLARETLSALHAERDLILRSSASPCGSGRWEICR